MSGFVRQLGSDELLRALDEIDLVEVLATELSGRVTDPGADRSGGWTLDTARSRSSGAELAVLSTPDADTRFALPSAHLRACRCAALTTLASQLLLSPGVVTVTVLGSGFPAHVQSAVLGRLLPDVSHVAVHSGVATPRLAQQFAAASIGLSVAPTADDAVFGATLVVVTGDEPPVLRSTRLARGAVVVNASGRDLPAPFVDCVSSVYVDDLSLLASRPRRYLTPDAPRRALPRYHRVEADLAQVLTAVDAGRTHRDDVLLVELLSTDRLDAYLALRVYQAVIELGLGRVLATDVMAVATT